MHRLLQLGVCCALASVVSAQTLVQQTKTLPAPVVVADEAHAYYRLDYETKELTHVETVLPEVALTPIAPRPLAASAATSCFDNPAYFTVYHHTTHPTTHQELVDWGVKDCGLGGVVTSFTFTYRTILPRVDLSVAFYLGTQGFGVLGTEIARFSFQGLPPGTPDGFSVPFPRTVNTITVDISSTPMCLPDGPIGWSFTNDDLTSGFALAIAPGTAGTLDALDVYDAPPATNGAYTGTFNFGTSTLGSLAITLEEDDDPSRAGVRLLQGSQQNPLALIPRNLPILERPWFVEPNFDLAPGADTSTLVLAHAALPPFATVAGEILIDLVSPPLLIDTQPGFHALLIPNSLAIGETFYAQSILSGPGTLQLTNGLEIQLGL